MVTKEIEPMEKSENQTQKSNWREKYRVRIGFIFGVYFIWRAQPEIPFFLVTGLFISLVGVLIRQWAAGCIAKMDRLATQGPYALVRNPLYLGSFLAAAGFILTSSNFSFSIATSSLDRTLFFWGFLLLFIDSIYMHKISNEEKNLKEKFPDDYDGYAARVPSIIPNKIVLSELDFSTFDWKLWLKNKEYYSLLGYALISGVLILRYLS